MLTSAHPEARRNANRGAAASGADGAAAPFAPPRLSPRRARFQSLDALFEPFETGECDGCNAADHRRVGHKGRRSVPQ